MREEHRRCYLHCHVAAIIILIIVIHRPRPLPSSLPCPPPLSQWRKKSQLYPTGKAVLVPLGDDFRYDTMEGGRSVFRNYERIIAHINSHPDMRAHAR